MAIQENQRRRHNLKGKNYITIGGIANYCMVSRSTIRRWIKEDKLSAMKLPSGHYRVSIADFKDFLERHEIPITQELIDY